MATNSIFIFMAGDNNLDVSGIRDIQEMRQSDIAPELNVIIQFDRRKAMWWEDLADSATKRLKVETHQITLLEEIGETNTGDPAVLQDFLEWGINGFPAKRRVAIIWNHGSGIKDTDIYKSVAGKVESSLFVAKGQRSVVSVQAFQDPSKVMHLQKLDGLSKIGVLTVATDDTARDFLDNFELKSALSVSSQKFDILAFDACLMSMFEIVYQVKNSADIVIGSEDNEPANGWPYKPILDYLSVNQMVDNEQLSRKIVALYGEFYTATGDGITQSATRTNSIERVAIGLDYFAGTLANSLGTIRATLADILCFVQRFREGDYLDLYDFTLLCQKNMSQPDIRQSAADLLKLLGESIIANITVGERVKNAHGLSIYFPLKAPADEVLHMYRKLDFTITYPNWLKLIESFHTSPTLQR